MKPHPLTGPDGSRYRRQSRLSARVSSKKKGHPQKGLYAEQVGSPQGQLGKHRHGILIVEPSFLAIFFGLLAIGESIFISQRENDIDTGPARCIVTGLLRVLPFD